MSSARRTLPSRLELNSRFGSFNDAPLANVSLMLFLYDSPVQMRPSSDHTGMFHFHSSTTPGTESRISFRTLARALPRQSPSSVIRFEINSVADEPGVFDWFMFSSSNRASRDTAVQINTDH